MALALAFVDLEHKALPSELLALPPPRNVYTPEFAESQAGVSVCVGGTNRFNGVRVCCMHYAKPRSSYTPEFAESQAGVSVCVGGTNK